MGVQVYHKDVFAPGSIFASPGTLRVRYGHHAVQAAEDDRCGDLSRYLRPYVDVDEAEIIEVEVTDGKITKRVLRVPIAPNLDLVMVVKADGFVKTVWGNFASDTHKTLDRSKFVHAPQRKAI